MRFLLSVSPGRQRNLNQTMAASPVFAVRRNRLPTGDAATWPSAEQSFALMTFFGHANWGAGRRGAVRKACWGDMVAGRFLILALLAACVAGCSADSGPKEVGGTAVGALAGGAIGNAVGGAMGNRFAGTLIGAAAGGLMGNRIGAAMDDEDRQRAYAAQMQALETGPSGAPVAWRNPDSGRYGNVVPGPAYQANNATCRQYTETVYIDGTPQVARGTACRNPDGSWTAMN
jgi:surface antigen